MILSSCLLRYTCHFTMSDWTTASTGESVFYALIQAIPMYLPYNPNAEDNYNYICC